MNTVPRVIPFFDPATWTFTYVVEDPGSAATLVIDPVLDYDPRSGGVSTESAAKVLAHLRDGGRRVDWILETHAHADHLSAAQWLKRGLGGVAKVGIGAGIRRVQAVFRDILGLGAGFPVDGRQFDRLFADGDTFAAGALEVRVMDTPGHTPDSVTFLVGDVAFVGDTVFSPGYGTARCDFPGGDAAQLYESIQKLYALPDSTRIYLCHDYPPQGQEPQHLSSPLEQRTGNVHLRDGVTAEAFVELRQRRDATLAKPVLLWPSVQVNIRAGELPEPDAAGRRFLKIPMSGATP
jgi:glyoxylase-like metal-dependent hydrolase (beta-lactamase superfamily II)